MSSWDHLVPGGDEAHRDPGAKLLGGKLRTGRLAPGQGLSAVGAECSVGTSHWPGGAVGLPVLGAEWRL